MNYKVLHIIDSILGVGQAYPKGEYYYHCVFCHHHKPKLAVNIIHGRWQCWKCGTKGRTLLSLIRKLDVSQAQIQELAVLLKYEIPVATTEAVTQTLRLPEEYRPLWEPSSLLAYKRALTYVKQRGLTRDDILRYQVGYCHTGKYAGRIIVPSFTDNGTLNYFVGRSYFETEPYKYLNPPISKNIIGFEDQISWTEPIVLCEGVFDAISIKINAIPLMGKTIPRILKQKMLESHVNTVYIALDPDAAKEMVASSTWLMNQGISVYHVSLVDKDPSLLGTHKTQSLMNATTPLTFKSLMQRKLSLI